MRRALLLFVLASTAWPGNAASAGALSAQLLEPRPEARRDLLVTIRLDDEAKVVTAASLEIRHAGASEWHRYDAERAGSSFVVTIPAKEIPAAGTEIELRAELFGKRGGLLFEIAHDEPVRVRVRSSPEAREEDRVFRPETHVDAGEAEKTGVSALVAVDGRMNSRARVRATLGVSFALSAGTELGVLLSVGPAFEPPAALVSGGPVVFGPELAIRGWAMRSPAALGAYLEPFVGGDLRLPGFDPYAGLRVGIVYPFEPTLALDLSLGGSASVSNAVGVNEPAELGFGGQLRIGVRFQEP